MALTTTNDHADKLVAYLSIEQLTMLQRMTHDQLTAFQSAAGPQIKRLLLPSKTFAIPELLEHILSYLEFSEVFATMRVSRTFLTTVLGSNKIQRTNLFMQPPEGLDSIPRPLQGQSSFWEINPHMYDVLGSFGSEIKVSRYMASDEVKLHDWQPPRPTLYCFTVKGRVQRLGSALPKPLKATESASWRQTYVTAFPLRLELRISSRTSFNEGFHIRCFRIEAANATMDAIYAAAAKADADFMKCEFECAAEHKQRQGMRCEHASNHRCKESV